MCQNMCLYKMQRFIGHIELSASSLLFQHNNKFEFWSNGTEVNGILV